jgi:DNA repair exonuclease SbcCD ATPase subunit
MTFKDIEIQNFFSFGQEEKLDLSTPGLYLVTGRNMLTGASNGAGKSTVFHAVEYALFGKVSKSVNIAEMINEQIGKNCRVSLGFNINGKDYWIDRFRKDEEFGDVIRVFDGARDEDHLISKAEKRDTQEIIDKIIKFNYKSFINAVMMSQETIDGFLEAESWRKKEIIENILQLNVITRYHWFAQQKRKLGKKAVERFTYEVKTLSNGLENVKKSMTDYVESCRKQKDANAKLVIELEKDLKKINETDIEKERALITEAERLALLVEQKMVDYQKIVDRVVFLEKEKDNYRSSREEYKDLTKNNRKTIKQLNQDIEKLNTSVKDLQTTLIKVEANPELCPLCENAINVDKLEHWKDDQNEKINAFIDSKDEKLKLIESSQLQIIGWETKDKDFETGIEDCIKKIKDENKASVDLKKEYEAIIVPRTMNLDELNELSKKKLEIEVKLAELNSKTFIDKEYLDKIKQQGVETLRDLNARKRDLLAAQKRFTILEWWEDSLSSKKNSMKSWCINNIIGYFNARLKYYMDRFFDGTVSIQMDTELNEQVTYLDNERTVGQFSGGEKRRLNLAILFALNSLIKANLTTKINIMFLDEVLSNSLDDKGISTVLELLEELKDNKETVFVIDHRDHFKDYPSFESVVVHKDKSGFSHIVKN